MNIMYLGHACFRVESDGYAIILDPYTDVPGYPLLTVSANAVLCSHEHFDHNARHVVPVPLIERPSPFTVEKLATFHDECSGQKRGSNTVHILRAEEMTVVHLGDLGHLLSEEQAAVLRNCDVLMIPVGGTYTVTGAEAAQIIEQLQPRLVIPMHYRCGQYGFDVLDTAEPFLASLPNWPVHRLEGCTLELSGDMPEGIVLPQFAL